MWWLRRGSKVPSSRKGEVCPLRVSKQHLSGENSLWTWFLPVKTDLFSPEDSFRQKKKKRVRKVILLGDITRGKGSYFRSCLGDGLLSFFTTEVCFDIQFHHTHSSPPRVGSSFTGQSARWNEFSSLTRSYLLASLNGSLELYIILTALWLIRKKKKVWNFPLIEFESFPFLR